MEQQKKFIDKLALIRIRDRKLLMARSKGEEKFFTIGGKRKEGESDVAALMREVREETGLVLDPRTVSFVHEFEGSTADGKNTVRIRAFTASNIDACADMVPSGEIAEIRGFASREIELMTPLGIQILKYYKNKNLID